MIRTTFLIIAVVSVATLLSEVLGLALLWHRGQLTAETIAEIRLALGAADSADAFEEEKDEVEQLSTEDYRERRTMRILELRSRREELDRLKELVHERRQRLLAEQDSFQKRKEAFLAEFEGMQDEQTSEAVERARGILLAMQPRDAVDHLMALPAEENVALLKGMPENEAAKIMQDFFKGDDQERQRGAEVFRAISQGEPERSLIDESLRDLTGEPTAAAN